jgi:hypothetical protein
MQLPSQQSTHQSVDVQRWLTAAHCAVRQKQPRRVQPH